MDLTFTWTLNGVLLDLEDPAGPYHRMEGVGSLHNNAKTAGSVCVLRGSVFLLSEGEYWRPDYRECSAESGGDVHVHGSDGGGRRIGGSETGCSR